jgi:hypothetical protein
MEQNHNLLIQIANTRKLIENVSKSSNLEVQYSCFLDSLNLANFYAFLSGLFLPEGEVSLAVRTVRRTN